MTQALSTPRFFHSEIQTKRFHCYSGFRGLCSQLSIFLKDPDARITVSVAKKQYAFTHTTKVPTFSDIELAGPDPQDSSFTAVAVFSLDLQQWIPYSRFLYSPQEIFEAYARYQAWAAAFTPLAAQPPQPSIPVESITGPKLLAAQALASGSNSNVAAAIAKVSVRTIENWKKEPDFRQVRDTFVQAFAANPFPTSGLHLIGELAQALTQCQTLLAKQGKPVPAAIQAQIRKGLLNSNTFLTKHGASSSLTNQETKP